MKSERRPSFLSRISQAAIATSLVFLILGFYILPANAAPTVTQLTQGVCPAGGPTTCTSASFTTLALGDVLIIAVQGLAFNANAGVVDVTGITSTISGFTFSSVVVSDTCYSSCGGSGNHDDAEIWIGTINTVGTGTITITFNVAAFSQSGWQILEVSGVSTSAGCTSTGGSGTGTSTFGNTVAQCSNTTNNLAVASLSETSHQALGGGSGWTLYGSSFNTAVQYRSANELTNFPFTMASADHWSEAGAIFQQASSSNTGSTTLGSCPTKNTATQALANTTEYFYTGSWLGNEVITNVTVEVASVNSGHVTAEQMYLAIYLTPNSGGISASNTFTLAAQKFFLLSATSAPQKIQWNAGFSSNFIPPGATVGIAVIGNSKILINQSGLAGMSSGASGAVPGGGTTGIPAAQYTSLSASAFQLYFCANANFQTVFTTTATTTVTTSTTVTSTSTVTSINPTSNTNLPLVLLFLFLPAGVFLGVTRNLSGGILGLIIGAVVCVAAGILSPFILTGLIIACVAIAFVVSRGGPNG